jgi:hypothetical protein
MAGAALALPHVPDADGQRYAVLCDWLFKLAPLGPCLPDFPHVGPAKKVDGNNEA